MAGKRKHISTKMAFTWLMLSAVILLLAPQSITNRIQLPLARLFYLPLSPAAGGTTLAAPSATAPPPAESPDERTIAQYEAYIANLELQLQQKNEQLRQLAGIRDRWNALQGAKLLLADLIPVAPDAAAPELVINRGSSDGLAEGFFVLADNSLIGTITTASARTSIVTLFTNRTSALPVRIGTIDKDMLLRGAGEGTAKIDLVPVKFPVKVGDFVYAKKKPGLLDVPMVVGIVTRCERDPDKPALWDITVGPLCDITRLGAVAVIVMNP